MPCTCASNWGTTRFAIQQGWTWRNASVTDGPLLAPFLAGGGTGNPSIDKFVQEELLSYAQHRFANSFLLLDQTSALIGFASNSMGTVKITDNESMGLNMGVAPQIPVLFLHRLGVLRSQQRRGFAKLLVWRAFEALAHSCTHSAAAAVALLVEPDNLAAKALYSSLLFERVSNRDRKHELHLLPYDSAIRQIPVI